VCVMGSFRGWVSVCDW